MFLDILIQNLHNSLFRYDTAKEYLRSRKVTEEEIKEFKIGYSKLIVVPKEDSTEYESFLKETHKGRSFENKIIFPVLDIIGRAIGLIGRSIDSKEFKIYLTPEGKYTGAILGLYQALPYIYETGKVFTVEGPFDLQAFRKAYKNSVSSLTAGLSDAQYEILNFFADQIITVFDSDVPGERATEEAKNKWKNVTSIDLGYKDPDQCFRELSEEKFIKFVRNRVNKKILF